jgi:hypothetical protein
VSRFCVRKGHCQNSERIGNSLSRFDLINIKARALRRGVWFRVLSRVERACVDLVARVVERVRSIRLQEMLSSILGKLEDAMQNPVQRLMDAEASSLAVRLSQIAQQWGNGSAVGWAENSAFIRFLAVSCLNAVS